MLNLREITTEDKQWFDGLVKNCPHNTLEYNFTTAFIWRKTYNIKVCESDGCLICMADTLAPSFLFPCGDGDTEAAVKSIIRYCKNNGITPSFHSVSPIAKDILCKMYPEQFEFTIDRDAADYIYETEKLISLSGKKLAAKRNHINRFEENFPDWKYEPITRENIDEVFEMNTQWCDVSGCENDKSLSNEACAVKQCFKHFFDLKLDGGLIRAGGRVVAFSMGDRLSDSTYLVHIEKAFADVNGAYPMINKQFVIHNASGYQFVDREDDAGVEGLRTAKLSYRPYEIAEKYSARMIL